MSAANIRSMVCALVACMALCTACLLSSCGGSDASSDQMAEESQNATETGGEAADDTSSEPSEAVDVSSDESGKSAQETPSDAQGTEGASAEASLTLEEYFNQNPNVYEQILESFQQGFISGSDESVPMTATLEAHDNTMVCRVVFDLSFDDDMVSAAQDDMSGEMDGYEETMTALISQLEESTGCSPIAITLSYYDKDGKTILEHTYE